jgi:hypothetical protein
VEQQALQRLAHLAVDNAAGIVSVLLSLPPIVDQGITPVSLPNRSRAKPPLLLLKRSVGPS